MLRLAAPPRCPGRALRHTAVAHVAWDWISGHSRAGAAAPGVEQDRVEHRAVHVVLALVERAVAGADGAGAGVAGQVVAGRLGEVPAAVDAVHDLEAAVVDRFELGDELDELVGLPVEVEPVERLEREGRVAHPRVAVVPVALPARRLGQRRREGGDRGPRRHVGEALDGEGGALQVLPVAVVDPASSRSMSARRRWWRQRGGGLAGVGGAARPSAHDRRAVGARPRSGRGGPGPGLPRCRAPCRSAAGSSARRRWRRRRAGRRRPGTRRRSCGRSRTRARRCSISTWPSMHSTVRTSTWSASLSDGGGCGASPCPRPGGGRG